MREGGEPPELASNGVIVVAAAPDVVVTRAVSGAAVGYGDRGDLEVCCPDLQLRAMGAAVQKGEVGTAVKFGVGGWNAQSYTCCRNQASCSRSR